ncbi:hypothetical protein ACFL6C_03815 [Myxococcota bacterium]
MPWRALLCCLVLAHLVACDTVKGMRRRALLGRANGQANGLAASVELARVRRAKAIRVVSRVTVKGDTIHVDNVRLLQRLEEERDPHLASLELAQVKELVVLEQGLDATAVRGGGYFIEPLFDAMDRVRQIEKRLHSMTGQDLDPVVELRLSGSLSFMQVGKIIYTVAQAGYVDLAFVVETPTGEGAIVVQTPRFCSDSEEAVRFVACPDLFVLPKGVQIAARRSPVSESGCPVLVSLLGTRGKLNGLDALEGTLAGLDSLEGQLGGDGALDGGLAELGAKKSKRPEPAFLGDADPAWAGRFILGRAGVCPSVPRVDGAIDVDTADRLLGRIKSLAPGCRRAIVGATDDTPWSDVVTMLAMVVVEHGFDAAYLAAGGLLPPEPDCSEAIPIDEVSATP